MTPLDSGAATHGQQPTRAQGSNAEALAKAAQDCERYVELAPSGPFRCRTAILPRGHITQAIKLAANRPRLPSQTLRGHHLPDRRDAARHLTPSPPPPPSVSWATRSPCRQMRRRRNPPNAKMSIQGLPHPSQTLSLLHTRARTQPRTHAHAHTHTHTHTTRGTRPAPAAGCRSAAVAPAAPAFPPQRQRRRNVPEHKKCARAFP